MPRIFVVGDPIIDRYSEGRVDHIAPDAPVGVFVEQKVYDRPGGMLNVANNLLAAGADICMFGVRGTETVNLPLTACSVDAMVVDQNRRTQRKTRHLGQYRQQVLRVDIPKDPPIGRAHALQIVERMQDAGKPDVILFCDYGCGSITDYLIRKILITFVGVPTVVDPYPTADPNIYSGVDVLKLNKHEATVLQAKLPMPLEALARYVIITDGPNPVCVKSPTSMTWVDVPDRTFVDACGAGDAFAAYFSVALASGSNVMAAAQIGAHAGACAISKRTQGCPVIDRAEVLGSLAEAGVNDWVL